jgi:hypothetical protein
MELHYGRFAMWYVLEKIVARMAYPAVSAVAGEATPRPFMMSLTFQPSIQSFAFPLS